MRRCRVCEREQPLTAFYAGSWALRCRACHRAYMRARRAAGLTQADERARYHAAVTIRGAVAENTKRWKARNPDKLRAEYAVADAIQRGTLTRQPCTVCGEKAQAHHADYTRPLEVQWLCPLHHARQHVAEGIPLCGACLMPAEADDLRLGFFLLNPAFYALTGHPWPRCARCTAEAMYKIPASWIPGPA